MLTPASTSQSRITRNDPVVVLNVRVSLRRPPRGPGVRTQTVNVSLPTSKPATRSNMTSMTPPSTVRRPSPHGVGPEGPLPGHRPACSKQQPSGTRDPASYTSNGLVHTSVCRRHRAAPHSHQPAELSKIASPIHPMHSGMLGLLRYWC